ncbi:MAG: hypothetical protein EXR70_22805 [Deltaproteobacteria bacterium]|nr:hypothetical protein [Deltaproteobacteria bacterium]
MAKQDRHDAQLKKGLATLAELGFATDRPVAETVVQLKAVIGKSIESDLATIFLLGKIADGTCAELLREIDGAATDKEIKKEIKRALFKLSQKGIAVAVGDSPEKKPAPLFERHTDVEAYMSPVDGGGGRLIWIARTQVKRGLQVIQAMLHDREGLLRYAGLEMKRKELRAMADDIKAQHGVTMIAIPWQFADYIIYQGYERAKARGQSGLTDFHEIRSLIGNGKPKPVTHPIYDKLGAEDFRDGAWREQSRKLLEEPELRYWIVMDEWVRSEYLPRLEAARSSQLVLNPAQKEERLAGVVRDAVKTLCSGDNGSSFKQRMEDMALYFFATERLELAKLSLAVARQVGEGDPGPLDVSFLAGLMQKSFAFFISQQKAQAEEASSSLIIKP